MVKVIQVFKHLGKTDGAGTGGAGTEDPEADGRSTMLADDVSTIVVGVVGGATHLVQIVEVMVLKIVDTVFEVWIISRVPDVTVLVTGQVVTVVWMLEAICKHKAFTNGIWPRVHYCSDHILSGCQL